MRAIFSFRKKRTFGGEGGRSNLSTGWEGRKNDLLPFEWSYVQTNSPEVAVLGRHSSDVLVALVEAAGLADFLTQDGPAIVSVEG